MLLHLCPPAMAIAAAGTPAPSVRAPSSSRQVRRPGSGHAKVSVGKTDRRCRRDPDPAGKDDICGTRWEVEEPVGTSAVPAPARRWIDRTGIRGAGARRPPATSMGG
ncbi:MAG: hypothetical protein IPO82_00175 [Betaproteobacteria bacterium]|nr:hypothetical protein [Betaproteobacteria bacterium]